jgi:hypothetical protein
MRVCSAKGGSGISSNESDALFKVLPMTAPFERRVGSMTSSALNRYPVITGLNVLKDAIASLCTESISIIDIFPIVNLKLYSSEPKGTIRPLKHFSKAFLLISSFVVSICKPALRSAIDTHGIEPSSQYKDSLRDGVRPIENTVISASLAHFQLLGMPNGISSPFIWGRLFCFLSLPSMMDFCFSIWIC